MKELHKTGVSFQVCMGLYRNTFLATDWKLLQRRNKKFSRQNGCSVKKLVTSKAPPFPCQSCLSKSSKHILMRSSIKQGTMSDVGSRDRCSQIRRGMPPNCAVKVRLFRDDGESGRITFVGITVRVLTTQISHCRFTTN